MTFLCLTGAFLMILAEIRHLSKEYRMTTVYVIGGIVSACLFVYLLVALMKPEAYS